MDNFSILVSGNAPYLFPTETLFGVLFYTEDDAIEIPKCYPYQGEWGEVLSNHLPGWELYPIPKSICLEYLSIVESKFYVVDSVLSYEKMMTKWTMKEEDSGMPMFTHIVIGMAPYGNVAIWVRGQKKSCLIDWMIGKEILCDMDLFLPNNPLLKIEDYCQHYINNDPNVKLNIELVGMPSKNLFNKYMQQFTYRYLSLFEHWNKDREEWHKYNDEEIIPEFDYIEETLFDGTHDKLHDGGLMNYHQAGKPKKLAVKWHIKKSEYTAYFWFEDEEICKVFDRFYGVHPETKTDFIIHIDAEKKKYQLAFFRSGLPQPVIIPERAYQLIVFKSKFENYRSNNYNQESGAWIW